MNLKIEDRAYEHILSKDNSIFIYTNSIRGCCGGQMAVDMAPRVEIGEPKDDNSYFRKEKYKDLTVYISKKVDDQKLENKSIVLKKGLGIFSKIIIE
ncbi:MAG: CC/Se motif family (seleno)protein [Halanaerobium sp.]